MNGGPPGAGPRTEAPQPLPDELVWLYEMLNGFNRIGLESWRVWQEADAIHAALLSAAEEAAELRAGRSRKAELRALRRACRKAIRADDKLRMMRGPAKVSRHTFGMICEEAKAMWGSRRDPAAWLERPEIILTLVERVLERPELNGRPRQPCHDAAVASIVDAFAELTGRSGRGARVDPVTLDRENERHAFVMSCGAVFGLRLVTRRSDHRMRRKTVQTPR